MRRVLDEATIRRIVRESVVRRMLAEEDDGPTLSFSGFTSLFGGGDDVADKPAEKAPLSKYMSSGRKRGEDAVAAIARLVGGKASRDPASGALIIDSALGAKVKSFIEDKKYVDRPFTVTDPDQVLEEWKESADSVPPVPPIGANGEPEGDAISFPPNADGLLRYLIVVQSAELGYRATVSDMQEMSSDYQKRLEPIVQKLVELINGPTSASNLQMVATEVLGVVKEDKTPKMIHTKTLLAGFARENRTTYEVLKPVALGSLTFGLLLLSSVSLVAPIPLATKIAAGAATVWGASAAYESAVAVLEDEPYADVVSHINDDDQDYLDELAVEVERTVFPLDRGGASFRDRLVPTLRRISASTPNRSLIVRELTELVNESLE